MVGDGNHLGGIETIVGGSLTLAYALGRLGKPPTPLVGCESLPLILGLYGFSSCFLSVFFSPFPLLLLFLFFSFFFRYQPTRHTVLFLAVCLVLFQGLLDFKAWHLGYSTGMIIYIRFSKQFTCMIQVQHGTITAVGIHHHHQPPAKTLLAFGTSRDAKIRALILDPELSRPPAIPGPSRPQRNLATISYSIRAVMSCSPS